MAVAYLGLTIVNLYLGSGFRIFTSTWQDDMLCATYVRNIIRFY